MIDLASTDPVYLASAALAAMRRVRVHLVVLSIGQPKLFPRLARGATKGTFTELFTKTFGYYRRSHDVYWPGLDFHALRTSFHGDLLNMNCSDALRRRLMGHAPQDEGEKSYAQGLSIHALYEQVCRIDLDISMIRSPFPKALPNPAMAKGHALGLRVI